LLARLFGRKPAASRASGATMASEPSLAQGRYPAARRLDGSGVVTSTLAPNSIDEATTSVVPAPAIGAPTSEMFVWVPPAPAPADSPPTLPPVAPAELPTLAEHAPTPLPIPEATSPSVVESADEPAVASTDDDFQLPLITPAGEPAAPAPAARQVAHHDGDDAKYARIASRSGSGFKGFCPVVLRDDRDLADASAAFTAEFESQTFSFSSATAQAKFTAEPEKYAPARGGQDVVCAAHGQQAAGSIDHAVWFRNRLYLFSSHESLRKFVTEPARFARDE
jgi:YHS domain-containing protein